MIDGRPKAKRSATACAVNNAVNTDSECRPYIQWVYSTRPRSFGSVASGGLVAVPGVASIAISPCVGSALPRADRLHERVCLLWPPAQRLLRWRGLQGRGGCDRGGISRRRVPPP